MKNNKKGNAMPVIVTIGIVAIVGILLYVFLLGGDGTLKAVGGDGLPPADISACPDDGDTSLKIQVYNGLNDTGAEIYDTTITLYRQTNGAYEFVETLTDTSSPTATLIDCGYQYKACGIAGNADDGNNSMFTGVKSGKVTIDSDGCANFNADRSSANINLKAEQHGVLTFRMFDNEDNRFAYDTGDADNTVFEADGTNFTDGTNTTDFAVGASGFLDFCIQVKGATADQDFIDGYMLVMIEAPVTNWNEPTVKWEGSTLTEISDSGLTKEEGNQFSDKEYVYKVTDVIGDKIHELCMYLPATSTDPTVDIEVDFATSGNYLSIDGVTTKHGAAKDDSSNTVGFTVQDTVIAVS